MYRQTRKAKGSKRIFLLCMGGAALAAALACFCVYRLVQPPSSPHPAPPSTEGPGALAEDPSAKEALPSPVDPLPQGFAEIAPGWYMRPAAWLDQTGLCRSVPLYELQTQIPAQIFPLEAEAFQIETIPLESLQIELELIRFQGGSFLLRESTGPSLRGCFSPDRQAYIFTAHDPETRCSSLYRLHIPERRLEKLSRDAVGEYDVRKLNKGLTDGAQLHWADDPLVSPDGRWIAYQSDRRTYEDFLRSQEAAGYPSGRDLCDIWVYDTKTGDESLLAREGYIDQWIGDRLIYRCYLNGQDTYYAVSPLELDAGPERLPIPVTADTLSTEAFLGSTVYGAQEAEGLICYDAATGATFSFPIPPTNRYSQMQCSPDRSRMVRLIREDDLQWSLQTAGRDGALVCLSLPNRAQQAVEASPYQGIALLGFWGNNRVLLLGQFEEDGIKTSYYILADLDRLA